MKWMNFFAACPSWFACRSLIPFCFWHFFNTSKCFSVMLGVKASSYALLNSCLYESIADALMHQWDSWLNIPCHIWLFNNNSFIHRLILLNWLFTFSCNLPFRWCSVLYMVTLFVPWTNFFRAILFPLYRMYIWVLHKTFSSNIIHYSHLTSMVSFESSNILFLQEREVLMVTVSAFTMCCRSNVAHMGILPILYDLKRNCFILDSMVQHLSFYLFVAVMMLYVVPFLQTHCLFHCNFKRAIQVS